MRAISIWQPYASLVAVGAKRVETRHWPAPSGVIGQRIAIHAGKSTKDLEVGRTGLFFEHLHAAALSGRLAEVDAELPLGFILATARLVSCEQIPVNYSDVYTVKEVTFGWFAPGRWAWELDEVRPLAEPVAWRGAQGFFNVPDSVVSR